MSGCYGEYRLSVAFRGDRKTAVRVCDALNVTLAALIAPTDESASALFTLGAEAVVAAGLGGVTPESRINEREK